MSYLSFVSQGFVGASSWVATLWGQPDVESEVRSLVPDSEKEYARAEIMRTIQELPETEQRDVLGISRRFITEKMSESNRERIVKMIRNLPPAMREDTVSFAQIAITVATPEFKRADVIRRIQAIFQTRIDPGQKERILRAAQELFTEEMDEEMRVRFIGFLKRIDEGRAILNWPCEIPFEAVLVQEFREAVSRGCHKTVQLILRHPHPFATKISLKFMIPLLAGVSPSNLSEENLLEEQLSRIDPKKSTAVCVISMEDFNGGLFGIEKSFEKWKEFNVVVVYIRRFSQIQKALEDVFRRSGNLANALIVAGHGASDGLGILFEDGFLRPQDVALWRLKGGSIVSLASCNVGLKGAFAEQASRVIPSVEFWGVQGGFYWGCVRAGISGEGSASLVHRESPSSSGPFAVRYKNGVRILS